MENIIISAWAHNCGMHVIADYLIEKLQQEDFKTKFTGKVYDELLKTFQNCYQQKELTWESIRVSRLNTTRMDAQVIWGLALRKMLFSVLKENAEYKKDLFNSFIVALKEAKKTDQGEVIENYPIIYTGNRAYFKRQTYVENALETNHLKYWNENGFDQYCDALIKVFQIEEKGPSNYLWLGQEELTLFCQYFRIKPIFISNAQDLTYETDTLYFHNPTQTHWGRQSKKKIGEQSIKESNPSDFEKVILNMGIALFAADPKLIGDIYFSDLYSSPTLGVQWLKDIGVDKLLFKT